MSNLLDVALDHARHGFRVFPLWPMCKEPCGDLVPHGCKDATTDEETIRFWWSVQPNANVAIATGNGLVIIDHDEHPERNESGLRTLHAWESVHGELPETYVVITSTGGEHHYYLTDRTFHNSTDDTMDKRVGVDIRGEGGYVVAAGSILPNGTYESQDYLDDMPIAVADDNVTAYIELVQRESKADARSVDANGKVSFVLPDIIVEGTRHDTLKSYAASLRGRGYHDDALRSCLIVANLERCKPTLPQGEVDGIIEWACGMGPGHDGNGSFLGESAPADVCYEDPDRCYDDVPYDEVPIEAYGFIEKTKGHGDDTLYALVNKQGKTISAPISHVTNSIAHHPLMGPNIAFSEFHHRIMVRGALPWDERNIERKWEDSDLTELYSLLGDKINAKSRENIRDGLSIYAKRNSYDPLKVFLTNGLPEWDGIHRADTLLCVLLGVEDNAYTRSAWRLCMDGLFMRGIRPGIKFDHMPVLYGPQGKLKTAFCEKLAVCEDWYLDGPRKLDDEADMGRMLAGKWICEQGELDSFKKSSWETIKDVLSRRQDEYVEKWQVYASVRKRRCVFIGTSNRRDFLKDCTGGRRFLPFEVGVNEPTLDLFSKEAHEYIIQAWAEVAHDWREGGDYKVFIPYGSELERMAEEERQKVTAVDGAAESILGWLDDNQQQKRVCGVMVAALALGIDKAEYHKSKSIQQKVTETLDHRCRGWKRITKRQRCKYAFTDEQGHKASIDYGLQTCWERIA